MADFNGHDAASTALQAAGADAMIGGDAAAVLRVAQAIEGFKNAAMLAAASIVPTDSERTRGHEQTQHDCLRACEIQVDKNPIWEATLASCTVEHDAAGEI